MNLTPLVTEILNGYTLNPWGYHGIVHWARVLENGLRLAEQTHANRAVVSLFAVFHDSRRENDGDDYGHGLRGAELAASLRGKAFELSDADFELLFRACEFHTGGRNDPDVTVRTCWDADRLDLGRVGLMPNPRYLCTPAAKSPVLIDWAHERSCRNHEPECVANWNVPRLHW